MNKLNLKLRCDEALNDRQSLRTLCSPLSTKLMNCVQLLRKTTTDHTDVQKCVEQPPVEVEHLL